MVSSARILTLLYLGALLAEASLRPCPTSTCWDSSSPVASCIAAFGNITWHCQHEYPPGMVIRCIDECQQVTIVAPEEVTLSDASFEAAIVELHAQKEVTLQNTSFQAGTVTIMAPEVTLSDTSILEAAIVELHAEQEVALRDTAIQAGTVTIMAPEVTLSDTSILEAAIVELHAEQEVALRDTSFQASVRLAVQAAGDLMLESATSMDAGYGAVLLHAGNITISDGASVRGRDVQVQACGDFLLEDGGHLSADSRGFGGGGLWNCPARNNVVDEDFPMSYGQGDDDSFGGGAVHVEVLGTFTVNGLVSADGGQDGTGIAIFRPLSAGGAGGSILVPAGSIEGSGTLTADGGSSFMRRRLGRRRQCSGHGGEHGWLRVHAGSFGETWSLQHSMAGGNGWSGNPEDNVDYPFVFWDADPIPYGTLNVTECNAKIDWPAAPPLACAAEQVSLDIGAALSVPSQQYFGRFQQECPGDLLGSVTLECTRDGFIDVIGVNCSELAFCKVPADDRRLSDVGCQLEGEFLGDGASLSLSCPEGDASYELLCDKGVLTDNWQESCGSSRATTTTSASSMTSSSSTSSSSSRSSSTSSSNSRRATHSSPYAASSSSETSTSSASSAKPTSTQSTSSTTASSTYPGSSSTETSTSSASSAKPTSTQTTSSTSSALSTPTSRLTSTKAEAFSSTSRALTTTSSTSTSKTSRSSSSTRSTSTTTSISTLSQTGSTTAFTTSSASPAEAAEAACENSNVYDFNLVAVGVETSSLVVGGETVASVEHLIAEALGVSAGCVSIEDIVPGAGRRLTAGIRISGSAYLPSALDAVDVEAALLHSDSLEAALCDAFGTGAACSVQQVTVSAPRSDESANSGGGSANDDSMPAWMLVVGGLSFVAVALPLCVGLPLWWWRRRQQEGRRRQHADSKHSSTPSTPGGDAMSERSTIAPDGPGLDVVGPTPSSAGETNTTREIERTIEDCKSRISNMKGLRGPSPLQIVRDVIDETWSFMSLHRPDVAGQVLSLYIAILNQAATTPGAVLALQKIGHISRSRREVVGQPARVQAWKTIIDHGHPEMQNDFDVRMELYKQVGHAFKQRKTQLRSIMARRVNQERYPQVTCNTTGQHDFEKYTEVQILINGNQQCFGRGTPLRDALSFSADGTCKCTIIAVDETSFTFNPERFFMDLAPGDQDTVVFDPPQPPPMALLEQDRMRQKAAFNFLWEAQQRIREEGLATGQGQREIRCIEEQLSEMDSKTHQVLVFTKEISSESRMSTVRDRLAKTVQYLHESCSEDLAQAALEFLQRVIVHTDCGVEALRIVGDISRSSVRAVGDASAKAWERIVENLDPDKPRRGGSKLRIEAYKQVGKALKAPCFSIHSFSARCVHAQQEKFVEVTCFTSEAHTFAPRMELQLHLGEAHCSHDGISLRDVLGCDQHGNLNCIVTSVPEPEKSFKFFVEKSSSAADIAAEVSKQTFEATQPSVAFIQPYGWPRVRDAFKHIWEAHDKICAVRIQDPEVLAERKELEKVYFEALNRSMSEDKIKKLGEEAFQSLATGLIQKLTGACLGGAIEGISDAARETFEGLFGTEAGGD